ncbi:MAG TPA: haloacid dehalogenase type II, partial [Dehalococcoidia bacterium]|nr:haloacid dehalogenase type II [Dehalococcoidia bacterium]
MADLSKIKALTFDVGGTVFDWRGTIEEELRRLAL